MKINFFFIFLNPVTSAKLSRHINWHGKPCPCCSTFLPCSLWLQRKSNLPQKITINSECTNEHHIGGAFKNIHVFKSARELCSDETTWEESEEGSTSKPPYNTTFPSDQKARVKYQTSNKQKMGKAEYRFRPKGVAHLIGMFFFPAF